MAVNEICPDCTCDTREISLAAILAISSQKNVLKILGRFVSACRMFIRYVRIPADTLTIKGKVSKVVRYFYLQGRETR